MPSLRFAFIFGFILPVSAANAAEANRDLWDRHCVGCHGSDGKGSTKMGRRLRIVDLTDPATQAKFTDTEAFQAIRHGRKDARGKITMLPVAGLSDEEIIRLVAFVRSLDDN